MEDFKELEKIYNTFQEKYMTHIEGSCEGCNYCCTSDFSYPPLSSLEYDFIYANREDKEKIKDFKTFMEKRHIPRCPFYSSSTKCSIYEFRPLVCRLFGVFAADITLPPNCIYKGKIQQTDERILFRTEEELKKFQLLKLRYEVKIAERVKDKIKALVALVEEYIARQEISSAEEILEEINSLSPKNPSYYFYKGLICRWSGKETEALKNFNDAINYGAGVLYPYIYEYMGFIYYEMEDLEKARETFKKALKTQPYSAQAFTGLALVNIKEASVFCKKILEIEPENTVGKYMMERYFSD